MNVSVMDLRDPEDDVLPSSLATIGLDHRGMCELVSGVRVRSVLGSRG